MVDRPQRRPKVPTCDVAKSPCPALHPSLVEAYAVLRPGRTYLSDFRRAWFAAPTAVVATAAAALLGATLTLALTILVCLGPPMPVMLLRHLVMHNTWVLIVVRRGGRLFS